MMGTKKSRLFAAVVFYILSVFALYMLFSLGKDAEYVGVVGSEALYDLAGFDFGTSIASIENRAYYYDKLLMPGEIDSHIPDDYGYAKQADTMTARARLFVPDGDYMIFGKTPEYASRIYVNGKLKIESGRIDEERGNIYRIDTYEVAAQPTDGVIEVVTHSAAIIREDASQYPVFLGEYKTAQAVLLSSYVKNLILLGIILCGALFFFGFYIIMPQVRANLWVSLISLTFAVQMAVSNKMVLKFFPNLDYRFTFIAENGTLIIFSTLYPLLIRALFGDSIPKLFIKIVFTVNSLLMCALIFMPIRITAGFLWAHIAVYFVVTAVSAACILRVIKRASEEQIISFVGQALFLYMGISDILLLIYEVKIYPDFTLRAMSLYYESANLSVVGMLLFLLAQMLALFLYNSKVAENERQLAYENTSLEALNDMKTKLLGNISHEMKMPLTVISSITQFTARHTTDGNAREKMKAVVVEINRMKERLEQIINMSRLEEAGTQWDFQPVDLRGLIHETISVYFFAMDEHNNTLTVTIHDGLPAVRADPAYLPGVIVNLIDNAIRFTRNGTITVSAIQNGNRIAVSVRDTGCGMTSEQTKHIFERYYSGEKSTGTGLGLYICKKTVEAHAGDISVTSEQGAGTAVTFTLPVYETAVESGKLKRGGS